MIDLDKEAKDIDLAKVFSDPNSGIVSSAPQTGGFFSRGSSISVTTIRGADGVTKLGILSLYFALCLISKIELRFIKLILLKAAEEMSVNCYNPSSYVSLSK